MFCLCSVSLQSWDIQPLLSFLAVTQQSGLENRPWRIFILMKAMSVKMLVAVDNKLLNISKIPFATSSSIRDLTAVFGCLISSFRSSRGLCLCLCLPTRPPDWRTEPPSPGPSPPWRWRREAESCSREAESCSREAEPCSRCPVCWAAGRNKYVQ